MDNKHYFGLYLIRIKHSLVLFSLLLTALQSLVYLLLAIFSERVILSSYSMVIIFEGASFLASCRSINSRNCSIYLHSFLLNSFDYFTSSRKISSCACLYLLFIHMDFINTFLYRPYSSPTIHIDYSFNGYYYIRNYYNSYNITCFTSLDGCHGINHLVYSSDTCYSHALSN